MSRGRCALVVAAAVLLALALCRNARAAGGAVEEAAALPADLPSRRPCAMCARASHADRSPEVAGPGTAEVLASLGYEVRESAVAPAPAQDVDDAAWMRPIAVGSVRRLPLTRVDAARAADRPRVAVKPRSTASPAPADAPLPATAVVPTGSSVAAAERVVSDGIILIEPGSLAGTPIRRGADGKVRVTNLSSGDYSVAFLDPVKVDGLLIPPMTELPVVGQIEIDLERDSTIAILPHASPWPSTPAPVGDG